MAGAKRLSTGIMGLDEVLKGGVLAKQSYLLRGGPGMGKTTVGMAFLADGAKKGDRTLYITLEEPAEKIAANARAMKIRTKGITFLDLSPHSEFFSENQSYDIFSSNEVETEPIISKIVEKVREVKPERVFVDSITQFKYLTPDHFQYRKQVLSFVKFLAEEGCTAILSSEASTEVQDTDLQFLCDGILELDTIRSGRAIRVTKFRGSGFLEGWHSLRLDEEGVHVYPKLVVDVLPRRTPIKTIPVGIKELDNMLGGGVESGLVTLVSGPSGVGKTTLLMAIAESFVRHGKRPKFYSFDEREITILKRADNLSMSVRSLISKGTLVIENVEPLLYSPDEFSHKVRAEIDAGVDLIIIDSIAGYRLAMRGEDMIPHLHALAKYATGRGATVLMAADIDDITGNFRITDVGISYLADNVVFMRYLELDGEIRRAMGVLKKRVSSFDRTLREYVFTQNGLEVMEPMTGLRGLLTGTPYNLRKDDRED